MAMAVDPNWRPGMPPPTGPAQTPGNTGGIPNVYLGGQPAPKPPMPGHAPNVMGGSVMQTMGAPVQGGPASGPIMAPNQAPPNPYGRPAVMPQQRPPMPPNPYGMAKAGVQQAMRHPQAVMNPLATIRQHGAAVANPVNTIRNQRQ